MSTPVRKTRALDVLERLEAAYPFLQRFDPPVIPYDTDLMDKRIKRKRVARIRTPKEIEASKARRVRLRRATPMWADRKAIAQIYREARRKSYETGTPHSVDHLYPIAGRLVSGLHVHHNLRVITEEENLTKGYRMPAEGVLDIGVGIAAHVA